MSGNAFSRLCFVGLVFFQVQLFADARGGFDHGHALWDAWLKAHVTVKGPASTVAYKKAKANPSQVKQYLDAVSAVKKEDYAKFSDKEKLAFLINAYNAFTVKLILDNYPVKSIKDLGSLFKSPWKKDFFKLFGESQTLDGIEHGMIRKQFKEPRIHMAVVCASIGCPMLRDEAWLPAKLEAQFEDSVKRFLSDPVRNRYDAAENELVVSKIFDWYGDDFKETHGSVQAFLAKYMAKTPDEKARMEKADIEHTDYDWNLNETK